MKLLPFPSFFSGSRFKVPPASDALFVRRSLTGNFKPFLPLSFSPSVRLWGIKSSSNFLSINFIMMLRRCVIIVSTTLCSEEWAVLMLLAVVNRDTKESTKSRDLNEQTILFVISLVLQQKQKRISPANSFSFTCWCC